MAKFLLVGHSLTEPSEKSKLYYAPMSSRPKEEKTNIPTNIAISNGNLGGNLCNYG